MSDPNKEDFFAQVKTAEMAQKIARRLHKPHGVFADFALRWVEVVDALEDELRVAEPKATPISELTWNPDTIRAVAKAIAEVLFDEEPSKAVWRVVLCAAAAALELIGHQIAAGCQDGSAIELPHPNTVFGEDAAGA